ncbi:methylated-DNA--[protein]-cysteine S-methyltransferase [Shimazuella kribbensis]|uniref:methylated-DNA--[protein]-cysteine S-methyltransferase n=1 Tax=Shimazuella kribbensis TaxID=139808 RepID=UPI00040F8CAB|nr:methylated-DNA--[protein]-cysteine S-methyltransferase [Shimazuella kribbensis]
MNTSKNNQLVYWTHLIHGNWDIYLAATEKGLCYVGSQNQSSDELFYWTLQHLPNYVLVQDEEKVKPYANELMEYFQGERQTFTIPVDLHGTPFQLSIWDALCNIPYGQTYSYSDIANHIGKPNAVRSVGSAIGANSVLIAVPCHRVIGKNGALTGYRGGLKMKMKLLSLEKERSNVERKTTNA